MMQPIHLAIGIVEGFVTAGVINYVRAARPEILDSSASATQLAAGISLRNVLIGFVALAVVAGGVLSWFASAHPDGLEGSIAKVTGKGELPEQDHGLPAALKNVQEKTAFLPGYGLQTGGGRTEGKGAGDARLAERRHGHVALGPDRRRPGPRGGVRDRMGDPGVAGKERPPMSFETAYSGIGRLDRLSYTGHGRPPAGPARQGGRHVAVRDRGRLLPEVRGPVAPPLLPVPGPDRGPRRHPGRFHREKSRRRLPLRGVRRDLQPALRLLDGRDRPRRLGSPPAGSPSRRSS